jgi:hypothetical protein
MDILDRGCHGTQEGEVGPLVLHITCEDNMAMACHQTQAVPLVSALNTFGLVSFV